jgi:catechol 2,3-dioxygenase-like lactoylglutathione lyase family enzyme
VALEVTAVVVDAVDPERTGRFWAALLERPLVTSSGSAAIRLPDGVLVVFTPTSTAKLGKNRLHFDLASSSAEDQAGQVARACALGAQTVDIGQGETPWVVLADPEGNEFCVLEPRDEYMNCGPLAAIVFDSVDPTALATFWSGAMNQPVVQMHSDYASVRREAGFWLEFVRVIEPKQSRNRLHLHLAAPQSHSFGDEVAALVRAHGASNSCQIVPQQSIALADPEGNEFCVSTLKPNS